jgi:hypothetical protein
MKHSYILTSLFFTLQGDITVFWIDANNPMWSKGMEKKDIALTYQLALRAADQTPSLHRDVCLRALATLSSNCSVVR